MIRVDLGSLFEEQKSEFVDGWMSVELNGGKNGKDRSSPNFGTNLKSGKNENDD